MNAPASNIIEYPAQQPEVIPAQAPMAMLSMAVAKGMSPETIKGFMDLQERWEKGQAERAYNEAFAAFKAEAVSVIRNKAVTDGPLRGKSYAELFAVVDAVTPALSKHGLSASWKVTKDERDWIEVTCYLKHAKGHFEAVSFGGPPDAGGAKNAIQARASTKTYLERYTLLAATGLSAKDADTDAAPPRKEEAEPDSLEHLERVLLLKKCASLTGLQEAWKALTAEQRRTLAAVKNECKTRIEAADAEAAK
jgi:hypothetical protein